MRDFLFMNEKYHTVEYEVGCLHESIRLIRSLGLEEDEERYILTKLVEKYLEGVE
jgi:hypothetical protein